MSPARIAESREERLAADPTCVPHGVYSTYRNWKCRCKPCIQAHTLFMAEVRKRMRERLAADPTCAVHGRNSTYVNWGCRCRPCQDAHAEAGRQ